MLRYVTSTLTACALAGSVGVLAQQQTPPPDQTKQAETLTGCVQEAKTTDGGKAFVLNKAQGGTAAMYVLIGAQESELSSQVNKKVEVTGQVQQPAAPPPDESANQKVLRPPIVQVESVKPVADSCN